MKPPFLGHGEWKQPENIPKVVPKIDFSVIIPTAGRPAFFREALQSVFNQSHAPYEVIVVHNGPMIGYEEFKDTADLTFVSQSSFLSVGAATNVGARFAQGQFLAFLEDDDYWSKDYLMRMAETIDLDKSPLYGGSVKFVDENKKVGRTQLIAPGKLQRAVYYGNPGLNGSNMVVERSFFWDMGGFSENLSSGQDRDFLARTIEAGFFALSAPGAVAFKRNHTAGQLSDNMLRSNRIFLRAHWAKMTRAEKMIAARVAVKRHFRSLMQLPQKAFWRRLN